MNLRTLVRFVLASAWGIGCSVLLGFTLPGCVATVAGAALGGYIEARLVYLRDRRALGMFGAPTKEG